MLMAASDQPKLYQLPIGRATFALSDVHARALALGLDEIARLVEIALTDARWAMQLMMSFQSGYSSLYPPAAVRMDGIVDHVVVGVESYLQVQIRIYRGEPRGDAAERLRQVFFPQGVAAVTRLPFAEEHAQIAAILERAAADDLAEDIALLAELATLLARLAERNREYGEILSAGSKTPTNADLAEARARCQERVVQVIGLLISHYGLREPDKTAERDHLLEPILTQNEAMRQIRRRRRPPTDIDPDTGEPVDDPPVLADEDDDELDDDAGLEGDEGEGGEGDEGEGGDDGDDESAAAV